MKNKIFIFLGVALAALTTYFFLNKKKKEVVTANIPIPKPPTNPIISDTPISKEEQKFIDLNGFETASIIILKVIDPIRVSGAADTEVYIRKLNATLKTNQMGWTRHGEEVFKVINTDGSFYYKIIPYDPIEPPIQD